MKKRVISFTISEDTYSSLKRHVKKESINSSRLIEKLIRRYLAERGVKK